MEGIDEEGRAVVREGDADHREDVSVVEVEEVRPFPVECHHLVVRGALRHRLDEHLLILLRPVTLNPASEHPPEGPFMSHGRQTNPLPFNLMEAVRRTMRRA